jgi:hypothetical protein
MAPFRERVLAATLGNAWSAMQAGEEIHGENWTLSTNGVLLHNVQRLVPLEQINGAAWYDDVFYLWQEEFDEPVLEVPTSALNALILADIMGSIVDGTPKGAATSNTGPGRMFGEFNEMRQTFAIAVGGGIALAVLLAIVAAPVDLDRFMIFGPLIAGGGAIAACSILKLGNETLRCFEREIVRTCNGKKTSIRYDQLESMSMRWVDHYYNHGYTHTSVEMKFEAGAAVSKPINFNAKCKRHPNEDGQCEALGELQQRASAAIADRLAEQLQREGRVAWTKKLTILPDGLEVKKLMKSQPQFIPYADIKKWSIDSGTLKIWSNDKWMSQAGEDTSTTNFFPGWMLFISLASQNRSDLIDERLIQMGV